MQLLVQYLVHNKYIRNTSIFIKEETLQHYFYVMFLWASPVMKLIQSHFRFIVTDTEQCGICLEMAKLVNPSVIIIRDYKKPEYIILKPEKI